ncbi:hypothetical protein QAD02_009428 [Eretmocerus hayati]|uniref:Uncharacterized protein n=1 Tax=Eretmocerus hayati TaxID=131215 RepID=A0ACC2N9B5_9HYME|nr:hypothetical protein QAD02_009428 [Eretmocerus hayati]
MSVVRQYGLSHLKDCLLRFGNSSYIKSIVEDQDKDCKIRYFNNTYKIFCSNLNSYRTLKEGVVQIQQECAKKGKTLEFYTHQLPQEKLKHIVAKGLPVLDTEEIKKELNDMGLKCVRCSIMKTKNQVSSRPLYLITFDSTVDMKEVWRIKHLYYVNVFWDRYKNPRKITQCHKCQKFGHGSSNCYNEARCLHCAEKHLTNTCSTKDATPKCTNCSKDHRANSYECEEYIKRLNAVAANKHQQSMHVNRAQARQPVPLPHEFPQPPWGQRPETSTAETTAWNRTTASREPSAARRMTTSNGNVGAERTWQTIHQFNEIGKVVDRIHQLCDVGKIFRKLQFLASRLEHCTSEKDQIVAFLECMNHEP